MSKSLGNHVGIAEPAAEQFGKLMSIPDDLLPAYLQYATGWPQDRIDAETAALAAGPAARLGAKRLLARTVADLYHGPGAGAAAEAEFDRVFKAHAAPTEVPELVLGEPLVGSDGSVRLSKVLTAAGLVSSNREAARKIAEGAVRVDGEPVREDTEVAAADLAGALVQVGRRAWVRIAGTRGDPPGAV
jgi:tyrosyl-tRNA synthetase